MQLEDFISEVDGLVREVGGIDADDAELTPDAELMDEGFVDSLGLVNVLLRLEKKYGVRFTDADAAAGNLSTIRTVASLAAERTASAPAATESSAASAAESAG
ncbi:MAG: acyl carrier protein [Phycisphaerales bacterium]